MTTTMTTDTSRERRVLAHGADLRSTGHMRLSGYAALYRSETSIAGMFREVIEPGAFRAALQRRDDVRALFNHDANIVLGRTASGTLRLSEDARGLRYELDLPDTSDARNLWTLVQRGDVSQSSFAFSVDAEEWRDKSAALPLRVVQSVRMFDVSPVTYPAYAETTVSARARQHVEGARPARSGDQSWRADVDQARAALATVEINAPVWLRGMPECFRRDPKSARAWASFAQLQHLDGVKARALRNTGRR